MGMNRIDWDILLRHFISDAPNALFSRIFALSSCSASIHSRTLSAARAHRVKNWPFGAHFSFSARPNSNQCITAWRTARSPVVAVHHLPVGRKDEIDGESTQYSCNDLYFHSSISIDVECLEMLWRSLLLQQHINEWDKSRWKMESRQMSIVKLKFARTELIIAETLQCAVANSLQAICLGHARMRRRAKGWNAIYAAFRVTSILVLSPRTMFRIYKYDDIGAWGK